MREVACMPAKKRSTIAPRDVPAIFSEDRVRELATIAKIPATADIPRLINLIRAAVEAGIRRPSVPTAGEGRAEIDGLLRAADRRHYRIGNARIMRLSDATRTWLNSRGSHWTVNVKIPEPGALLDPEKQD